jgi:hypothetical protein
MPPARTIEKLVIYKKERRGMYRSWTTLRVIYLEITRKTTPKLSEATWSSGRNINPRTLEYEKAMLPNLPWRLALHITNSLKTFDFLACTPGLSLFFLILKRKNVKYRIRNNYTVFVRRNCKTLFTNNRPTKIWICWAASLLTRVL